jgi:hypothetical protein
MGNTGDIGGDTKVYRAIRDQSVLGYDSVHTVSRNQHCGETYYLSRQGRRLSREKETYVI